MSLIGSCMYCKQRLYTQRTLLRGFSLLELLVSISIIMIATGIVIVRNNAFEGAVLLRNQAYEVAFTIREAQLLAVSGAQETANVRPYGVYITSLDGGNQEIIIFEASSLDRTYNNINDLVISTVRLDRRFEISGITGGDNISITFLRPNYDAQFSGGITGPVDITIRRVGTSQTRTVQVGTTGQVSVP